VGLSGKQTTMGNVRREGEGGRVLLDAEVTTNKIDAVATSSC